MSQLELLRKELAKEKLDAYVVPSADAHNSEYAADYFKRRGYVTGFNGTGHWGLSPPHLFFSFSFSFSFLSQALRAQQW